MLSRLDNARIPTALCETDKGFLLDLTWQRKFIFLWV